jgi:MFS family permease
VIETEVKRDDFPGMDSTVYNLQYAAYSYPNLLMPFLGGIFLDIIGRRSGYFIFGTLTVIGQAIYTIGAYGHVYWLMIVGRVIFGLGSDTMLSVALLSILNKWFYN